MSIIRTAKPYSYTIINNEVFDDKNPLSWEAMGLLCYLLSKPDNWSVSATALANLQKCGLNKVHSLLKELKQFGYVVTKKSNTGKLDYFVFDNSQVIEFTPNHGKPNQGKPNQGKPNQGKPNQEFQTLINTESVINTDELVITDSSLSDKEKNCFLWIKGIPFWDELINDDIERFLNYYRNGDLKNQYEKYLAKQERHHANSNRTEINTTPTRGTGYGKKLSLAEQAELSAQRLAARHERERQEEVERYQAVV